MKISTVMLFVIITALIACGGNKTKDQDATTDDSVVSCLANLVHGNEIEKMISTKQVAELIDEAVDKVEVKDNKSRSAEYSTINYNWPADEERFMIMKIDAGLGRTVEQKSQVPNKIIVGNIDILDRSKSSPKEYFRRTYGPKTKEEKESIKESIDESQKASNEVDEKSSKMIKKMLDEENSNEVQGVGDMAFWSYKEYYGVGDVTLLVLHGDTMFKVTTDVSSDKQKDLEVAKKVAQTIITNCN